MACKVSLPQNLWLVTLSACINYGGLLSTPHPLRTEQQVLDDPQPRPSQSGSSAFTSLLVLLSLVPRLTFIDDCMFVFVQGHFQLEMTCSFIKSSSKCPDMLAWILTMRQAHSIDMHVSSIDREPYQNAANCDIQLFFHIHDCMVCHAQCKMC